MAWLLTIRLAGPSLGAVASPFVGVLSIAIWYAVAVIAGWLFLLALSASSERKELVWAFKAPASALGIVALFYLGLAVFFGLPTTQWINRLVGRSGSVSGSLLGIVLSAGLIVGLLALCIGLVVALWCGAEGRFRAQETHPALPAIADVIVGCVLLGEAVVSWFGGRVGSEPGGRAGVGRGPVGLRRRRYRFAGSSGGLPSGCGLVPEAGGTSPGVVAVDRTHRGRR